MDKTPGAVGTCLASIVRLGAEGALEGSSIIWPMWLCCSAVALNIVLVCLVSLCVPAILCIASSLLKGLCCIPPLILRLTTWALVLSCVLQLDEMSDGPGPADPVATGADVPAKIPRVLSTECRVLADIAQPPDMKKAFDASLSILMLKVINQGKEQGILFS